MSIKVKKKLEKKLEKEIAEKVSLFNRMPDDCLTCLKPFDKKDRQMVLTWYVVVHKEEEEVNLYCPQCWEQADKFLEEK